MILVIARASCRPERRADMVAALLEITAATRSEPGCRKYSFYSEIDDDNSFVSVEEWDDRASVDAHFRTPHLAALMGKLPDLVAAPPTIEVHDVARTSGPPG